MNARMSFLVAFFLAGAGAFALSAVDSRWIPVGWAVLVMLGFLGWVKLRLPEYADSQGFADDFYFLGFLLTLVALATALLKLGDLGQAELLSTVLAQFGLALGTTIVGLAGRTILLLDKEETDGTEERARRKVEMAFDSLAQSLTRLSTEADVFSMQFAGKLTESLAPVERTVSRFATTVEVLDSETKGVGTAVAELATRVQAASSSLTTASQGLSDQMETAGRQVHDDLESIGERIREAGSDLSQQLPQMLQALDQADARSRASVEEALERLLGVSDAIQSTSGSVSQASEEITAKLVRDLEGIATAFDQLHTGAQRALVTVTSGAEDLDVAKEAWRAQTDELARVQRDLVGQATATGSAVSEVRQEIANGVDQLVRALRAHGDQ